MRLTNIRIQGAEQLSAEIAAEDAQTAWDQGKLAYVFKLPAISLMSGEEATDIIDGVLRIGWQLHSTGHAMLTFLRPNASAQR
jgi:hypothetical protein